jgi:uncharacterized protein YjdB
MLVGKDAPSVRFRFTNNIIPHGKDGVQGDGMVVKNPTEGINTLEGFAPGYVFTGNLIGRDGGETKYYPAGNYWAESREAMGLVNFQLPAGSPFARRAADGTTPGADMGRVLALTAGVRQPIIDGSTPITPVAPAPVASIDVTPATDTVEVERALQLATKVKDAKGNLIGRAVTWTSSNPTVATVSSSGLVKGVAAGAATITVSVEGKSAKATIVAVGKKGRNGNNNPNPSPDPAPTPTPTPTPEPTPAPTPPANGVATIQLYPATATVKVGQLKTLIALPKDAKGKTLSMAGRTVTWTSSDPAIASVSGTNSAGIVTARASGKVRVTVEIDGKTATADITVTN